MTVVRLLIEPQSSSFSPSAGICLSDSLIDGPLFILWTSFLDINSKSSMKVVARRLYSTISSTLSKCIHSYHMCIHARAPDHRVRNTYVYILKKDRQPHCCQACKYTIYARTHTCAPVHHVRNIHVNMCLYIISAYLVAKRV